MVTQLFSPNPVCSCHIVHVEMLLVSLLNVAVSSTTIYYFTKRDFQSWSDFSDHISSTKLMVHHYPSGI